MKTHSGIPRGASQRPAAGRIWPGRFLLAGLLCLGLVWLLWAEAHPGRGQSYTPVDPTGATNPLLEHDFGHDFSHDFDPAAGRARVSVVVKLATEPVIAAYLAAQADDNVNPAALTAITQAQLAAVEAQQEDALASMAAQGIAFDLLYRNQRVYNGIGLIVDAHAVDALAALPNVSAVYPLNPKSPATQTSVPHIHAPALWQGNTERPGYTGRGVRIAVIDTGIDYLHVAFGGPGHGYAENNPRIIGDVPNFPGAKVVGGWDFAGDEYNADPEAVSYSPIPRPNPDPMDCYAPGHGTHVGAIAAGYGVTSGGATYAGPYDAPLTASAFRMGPGVAPHAELYALKVFGCQGKTALTDAAIEWAVDPNRDGDFSDRVDVINLSLGSGYGAAYDSSAVAADNAARLGVVVVASAGNSGDTTFAVGTPGVAEAVISVASTRQTERACPVAPCPLMDSMADFSARGPRRVDALLKPDLAAPGFAIQSARARSGNQTVALSGTSMSAPHVAGAVALLLESTRAQPPAPNAPILLWHAVDLKARLMNTSDPQIGENGTPARMGAGAIDLSRALATEVVVYDAALPHAVGVSFGAPPVVDWLQHTRGIELANRGPHAITFTVSYSPLVAAPGVHFALSGADENGARQVTLGPYGTATLPLHMEADAHAMTRSTQEASLAQAIADAPLHRLPESGGHLVFVPQESDHPTLRLPIYAAPEPVASLQATPPLLDFGKAIAATQTVRLVGQGLAGSEADDEAGDETVGGPAAAAILELHRTSGRRSSVGGLPPPMFDHADLQYVGATHRTTGGQTRLLFGLATHGAWSTPNEVEFNIWLDTNGDRRADYRLFNSEREGYRNGLWSEVRGGDVFVAVLENLATGERVIADYVNGASAAQLARGVYHTNVILLPVPLALLAWDAEQETLNYRVSTYSRSFGNHPLRSPVVDSTPWLHLQLAPTALQMVTAQSASLTGSPLFVAQPDAEIRINYRIADYIRSEPPGLLLFQLHNQPGRRTQVLPIHFTAPYDFYFPWLEYTLGPAVAPEPTD